MATRILPLPAPAEPASPRLEPNAEMLLAPPPNLSKRLTAAVHRSLPGWTVEVLVKRWTDSHVDVVIKGLRDADALAPPAPPTGSAEAERLASRVARALERAVEQRQPATNWLVVPDYSSTSAKSFRLNLAGEPEGKKNDPPTCIDGEGEVIFPDVESFGSPVEMITVSLPESPSSLPTPPRCVFFHYHGRPNLQTLPVATLTDYAQLPANHVPPTLYDAGSPVVPQTGLTYWQLVTTQTPLPLSVGALTGWWVWW